MEKPGKFYVIADAHIVGGDIADSFFALLDRIAKDPIDSAVVFLGDIFELWVALPRYEYDLHFRFLEWCSAEIKRGRLLYFLEGNHEYFVAQTHADAFTECSDASVTLAPLKFMHGDTINRRDWKYRVMRSLIRTPLTVFLLRVFAPWFGPALTDKIRRALKTTNMVHKKVFPIDDSIRFLSAEQTRNPDVSLWLFGHFHEMRELSDGKGVVLPSFADERRFACYFCRTGHLVCGKWPEYFESGLNNEEKSGIVKG